MSTWGMGYFLPRIRPECASFRSFHQQATRSNPINDLKVFFSGNVEDSQVVEDNENWQVPLGWNHDRTNKIRSVINEMTAFLSDELASDIKKEFNELCMMDRSQAGHGTATSWLISVINSLFGGSQCIFGFVTFRQPSWESTLSVVPILESSSKKASNISMNIFFASLIVAPQVERSSAGQYATN